MNQQNLSIKELTLRGIIIGALITVVFTASNIYLGLKVGLTFSSSIPAAVISMAILRLFGRTNILENNIVQTQASAAGTLSCVLFILPGLIILGYWHNFPFWQTTLTCASGGMLGVLFSIPLRHALVVNSALPYPEGVAAAEILKAGAANVDNTGLTESRRIKKQHSEEDLTNSGVRDILWGAGIATLVNLMSGGWRILSNSSSYWFTYGRSIFQLPLGFSLAMLSAGYLMGVIPGLAILLGIVIDWGIVIPYLTAERVMPVGSSYSEFANSIWQSDVRFIGIGVLAVASIWTILTLIKPVIQGTREAFNKLKLDQHSASNPRPETDRDLSSKSILLLAGLICFVLIFLFHSFISESHFSTGVGWMLVLLSVILCYVIGFLIASVCGYMAGLIGSSASPLSGISIISISIISVILVFISNFIENADSHFMIALALFVTSTITAIACIANDNLQDLKTGYLVKATPWRQQIALLIGCAVGASVIAPILDLLYQAYGFNGALPRPNIDLSQVLAAPQATLMVVLSKGIFNHNLRWNMFIIGVIISIVIIAIDALLSSNKSKFRLPVLAVGLGIYLPPTATMPIVIGAILSWIVKRSVHRYARTHVVDFDNYYKPVDRKATLIASGFIVGESLIGVLLAAVIVVSTTNGGSDAPLSLFNQLSTILGESTENIVQISSVIVFILCCLFFVKRALSGIKKPLSHS